MLDVHCVNITLGVQESWIEEGINIVELKKISGDV